MAGVVRVGISLDGSLLEEFDRLIEKLGYPNRSEAIRDLIRDKIVTEKVEKEDRECVGVVTIVYNHHKREISDRLVDLQHDMGSSIISTLHIHLDGDNCLEVIVLKDRATKVKDMADRMIGTKGVKHGKLVITTTGKEVS